ncbi:MAG: glycosyltransferase [Bacteroidia bacterium]|nr:glycosyltransferase [Bacteroidia bacterium]
MRVLILYTELAGYVLGNISRFINLHPDAKLLLVHYPVNPEAPFDLSCLPATKLLVYGIDSNVEISSSISEFNPNIVLCSGWSNKQYLNWVSTLDKSVKKVICFDNQWKGSFKQWLLTFIAPFTFIKMFSFAWVPGAPQKKYAMKLGFKSTNIYTGLYPADTEMFIPVGKKKLSEKGIYPRKIISVARYIPQKDLNTLWNAFIKANEKTGGYWHLDCFGFGELFEQKVNHPTISHHGFKQPSELESYVLQAGVYVLPSIYEPWGVAVHEMALCALPLILSDKVGAGTLFLNSSNGFSFQAGNEFALESVLIQLMQLSDDELWNLAENSYGMGLKLKSEDWAKTLVTINQYD